MRIFSVGILLIAIAGCSPKPKQVQVYHILPVNFSGIYVIQKGQEDSNSYKVDGERYIFEIPKSGILKVTPDAFEKYCIDMSRNNIRLTASFSDGKVIDKYSPLSQPADPESQNPMLHGILGARDSIWYAVGSYKQLKEFSEKWRKESPEKIKLSQYAGLEEYLPPNTPFQTEENTATD